MVKIGQTYLDRWGRQHEIKGYVVSERGYGARPDVVDKERVYSSSDHFFTKTGLSTSGRPALVVLSAKKEITYWGLRIEEIEAANPPDKLKLVEDLLENMRNRIKELESLARP